MRTKSFIVRRLGLWLRVEHPIAFVLRRIPGLGPHGGVPGFRSAAAIDVNASTVVVAVGADAVNDWLAVDETIVNRLAGDAIGGDGRQQRRRQRRERLGICAVLSAMYLQRDADEQAVAHAEHLFSNGL